ncbi:hypothetical protein [Streptomyces pseudovenezuelae]|uniref:hypothetical protein n=1 Tax=Streptomyces pseudovenezuelae TaxID=67350 RepID=UPI002E308CD1|nr:hypothetical protein [Streptomyces pseudovenezuelae]
MSDALDKAEAAVREASTDTVAVQLAFAAMELAKLAQQPAPPPACGHQHQQGRSTGEWIGIGCAICIGGVGIAFASIAIAIGGISVAILALVLRSMWRDINKTR